jgi:hypothetical protein
VLRQLGHRGDKSGYRARAARKCAACTYKNSGGIVTTREKKRRVGGVSRLGARKMAAFLISLQRSAMSLITRISAE